MYLTVSIGPSQMESSTEFVKKFFFQWSPLNFVHLNLPTKIPQTCSYILFQRPTTLPAIPRNKPRKHMNPVINN